MMNRTIAPTRVAALLCALMLSFAAKAGANTIELELQRSADLQDWETVPLTPNQLTEDGKVRQPAGGSAGFFRQRITQVEAPEITPQQFAAIHDIVEAALTANEIPGILYGIKFPGQETLAFAQGVSNVDTEEPLQPDDRFRIGSASKTFIGMAALRLIQQGELGFEHSISDYLPPAVLSNYDRDSITIRMLLRHTTGVNNYTNIIDDWFFPYIENRTRIWTNEELVELINVRYAASPPEGGKVFDPGQGWFYSNTNTVLLGMIVEEITGQPIGQHITETFITPLGLADTFYPAPGESVIPGFFTSGYTNWADFTGEPSLPSTLEDVTVYDPSGVGPAGPMISTVADLCAWMEVIARNDEVIGDFRRGHIDWRYFTSFSGSTGGESTGSYGMNLAHEPDTNNNADYYIVGHRGQISGYDTAMMYLPDQEVALVLVCNRSLLFGEGLPTNALEVALNDIIEVLYPEMIAENQLEPAVTSLEAMSEGTAHPAVAPRFQGALNEYR